MPCCPNIIDKICVELSDSIDSELCKELKAHLEGCPECRAYVDTLKKTIYLYRQIPDENVPGDFQKELFKKLKF